ncbi:uncharacterized protein LOC117111145 [Anneissia japonica]|uniref:uncharacterized protein LOC117111145 n=1 Tax=Anneissia japonica TaxID=1529436 RepID=UPI0014254E66|nr:uncharacterized protein LOC117111145 [Anneissia japonica]
MGRKTFTLKTLDDGDQALVYNRQGRARIEHGPKRMFLWRSKYQILNHVVASQKQYLKICFKNGDVEYKEGPCRVHKNPMIHSSVFAVDCISLDANEVVVIYGAEEKGQMTRRLQYGPTLFAPKSNEWLHNFSWHGTDPNHKTRKIPGILNFNKLWVVPDQLYFNVEDVRTKDDALLKVKLMIFFELSDIELMLSRTSDPIADIVNDVSADIVTFTSQVTYEEFNTKCGKLNKIETYPELMERSKLIGYHVSKVVFRGYHASTQLEALHHKSVETRTRLKLMIETEEQEQSLTDMKLKSEISQSTLKQQLAIKSLKHKHQLELQSRKYELEVARKAHQEKLQHTREEEMAKIEAKNKENNQKVDRLRKLQEVGVDISEYLISKNRRPDYTMKVIAPPHSNVHVHQS